MLDLPMCDFISPMWGPVTWKVLQVDLNKNPHMSLYLPMWGSCRLKVFSSRPV
jgi:hypothetical protein